MKIEAQYRHRIRIEGGKVKFINRRLFDDELLMHDGEEAYLIIKPCKNNKNRSINQNNYYWGVVVKILGEELGYTNDEIHEIIKQKFLVSQIVTVGREEYRMSSSTSRLTTKEFEELMSRVRVWASGELGIYIPEPNEVEV